MLIERNDCEDFIYNLKYDFDLCLTSPPYGNLRKYHGFTWTKDKQVRLASFLYRKANIGAVVVWVVGDETKHGSESGLSFEQAQNFMSAGFLLHDTMIFKKESPPLSHNRYEQKFEYMFIFSKGKPKTFNGLRELSTYAGSSRKSITRRQQGSDHLSDSSAKGFVGNTKLKGNVWEYGVGYNKSATDKLAYKHPAIFPERLAEDHILTWTNKDDIVIDPFVGSGTTAKMAKKHGRRFFGCDVSKSYVELARERIQESDG